MLWDKQENYCLVNTISNKSCLKILLKWTSCIEIQIFSAHIYVLRKAQWTVFGVTNKYCNR